MKILILGGTGAMGIHLVKLLADAEHELHVTSRREMPSSKQINYLKGDAKDLSFIEPIISSNHWDSIVDFMIYTTGQFESHLSLFLDNTKQYVYFSSSRVYANSKTSITEMSDRLLDVCADEEYLATDEYALTKARQENLLISSGRKNWTIIRPYITYSENRLQLGVLEKEDWLYRAINNKTIVFSKDILEKYTTLSYGLDVAKGIQKLIANSEAWGEYYHITCPPTIKWAEVLNIYMDELQKAGYKPKVKLVDLETFYTFQSKWQVKYDRLYDRAFDNSKISQQLSPNFIFVAPEEGLRNCLQTIIKENSFNQINRYKHFKMDMLTGDTISFSELPGWKMKLKYLLIKLRILK